MRNLSSSKLLCTILLFCVATAIASPAQFTTLYSFCPQGRCPDGAEPDAPLVQATDGNFYGTTRLGGTQSSGSFGTVFKITPSGALTTLHSFDITDGDYPRAGLVQATDGNFYGTTYIGGNNQGGTVFKITAGGTLTTLYRFCSHLPGCADGLEPVAGLVQGADGNLYGTTNGGGAYGYGTVFKINLSGALTTLHSFDNSEFPYAGLVQGADGNLYGTTSGGGAYGYGTVFKITPSGMLTTLYSFCPAGFPCADGADPFAGLVQATDGNFYGTTFFGGTGGACSTGCGTIFAITAGGTLTTVHSFDITDGSGPDAPLVQATDGNLYGTTPSGGAYGPGTVFRLVPTSFHNHGADVCS